MADVVVDQYYNHKTSFEMCCLLCSMSSSWSTSTAPVVDKCPRRTTSLCCQRRSNSSSATFRTRARCELVVVVVVVVLVTMWLHLRHHRCHRRLSEYTMVARYKVRTISVVAGGDRNRQKIANKLWPRERAMWTRRRRRRYDDDFWLLCKQCCSGRWW